MKLIKHVSVNARYTRSVNIERDVEFSYNERPYVVTRRAAQTLERIAHAIRAKRTARAWALIGPYGSGKSAFGLFLASLLANPESESSKHCRKVLRGVDPELAAKYHQLLRGTSGFCSVVITGGPEPLARRVVDAMSLAAFRFFAGRRGKPPKIIEELRLSAQKCTIEIAEVTKLVLSLQAAIYKAGGRGVLVVIDELGKFLEHEARHGGTSDIYLLQTLAEQSVKSDLTPLVLVVLLHQSFEIYAQKFGEQLKNEWKKVSGRFESIPFLETAEQTVRIIKAALHTDLPAGLEKKIAAETKKYATILRSQGALPTGLPFEEVAGLFTGCYPIHPISLLVLPTLCQKVAQNERTLFSYLGSHEPHGFIEALGRLEFGATTDLPWIFPKDVYEYFILNQPGLTVDHATHRRWAEVVTALERLGDAPPLEGDVLKTIGLLNIIGAQGGLKASNEILPLCFISSQKEPLRTAIGNLQEKSLIAFRRFSREYRVWQGSDFDLEAAVAEHRAQIGRLDIAEVLNGMQIITPMVARRHSIATGTLRYFLPEFVSKISIGRIHPRKNPTLFLCLAETQQEKAEFGERLRNLGSNQSLGVIYDTGTSIREAVIWVQALRRVQRQSQELTNDPVAMRELKDRLASAIQMQSEVVSAVVEEPESFQWIANGASVTVNNKRHLQSLLSEILERVYDQAPLIRNELVNRDKPSSTAIAGRKKLLLSMLTSRDVEDLGIEKFPAEKAMYRAILRSTGLHRQVDGVWKFTPPPDGPADEGQMRPVWNATMALLDDERSEPVPISTVYATLTREPYGVKQGVLPILLLATYQALDKEIALSENGHFVPFLTQDVLEGILKTPAAYSLQRFQLEGIQKQLLHCYAEILAGARTEQISLVEMLQPLAKMMIALPDYTKKTRRLSTEAIAVRDLFYAAKTPLQLVFSDLPLACGVTLKPGPDVSTQLHAFSQKLKSVLAELRVAYHALLNDFVELLKGAFSLDKKMQLHDVREALRSRSHGLQGYTIDELGLKAFIGRIQDPYGDESQWLVSLASFLARKPPEKWSDDDVQAVKYRLSELVSRLNDLRHLQLHYERGGASVERGFGAALVRIISTESGESEALVTFDSRTKEFVSTRTADLRALLAAFPTREAKLAALIDVLTELVRPINKDALTKNNKVA